VYFARRADRNQSQKSILKSLEFDKAKGASIILSDCYIEKDKFTLPINARLINLLDLLDRRSDVCQIDEDLIEGLISVYPKQKDINASLNLNFSSDYRTVLWNGDHYTLTTKQAAVFRALIDAGGMAHKNTLSDAANSNDDLHRIMRIRVNGKLEAHPLWNTLLIRKSRGYYALAS